LKERIADYRLMGILVTLLVGLPFTAFFVVRQRVWESEARLRELSLVDDLTGLYNRRGFRELAAHQIKTAGRLRRRLSFVYVDLDRMKWINDTWGHEEGDRALKDSAAVLRETFRASDIIARVGGDEFAVLALESPESLDGAIMERLLENVRSQNSQHTRPYDLSLSVGVTQYDPEYPCSLDELLSRGDRLMYGEKQNKGRASPGLQSGRP
jgi:diguanylate cyclase (GGDEF)-like protein